MSRARFAFAAHPDAITDLRELPDAIRDQALLHLQELVHGGRLAKRLDGPLDGFHKVYLGVGGTFATHRLVVQFRDAPPSSQHAREVFLVAAGARKDYAVYRTAQQRTRGAGPHESAATETVPSQGARIKAAMSRSSYVGYPAVSLPQATPAATHHASPGSSRKA